jgi:cell division protein FtsX
MMGKKMRKAYVMCCIGCRTSQKQLFKLAEAYICKDCRETLAKTNMLVTKDGARIVRVPGTNQLQFISKEKYEELLKQAAPQNKIEEE